MKEIIVSKPEDICINKYDVITDTRGNRGGKYKSRYLNCVSAFDIETSRITVDGDEVSFMYVWQFAIENTVIIGRYWSEFIELMDYFKKELPPHVRLVTYVHNLSYEFSFLQGIHKFDNKDVFATKPHKVLKAVWDERVEFRCNYMRTNMSLDKWLKSIGSPLHKMVGDLDYETVRYPWTELSDKEKRYCIIDVTGLVEGVHIDLEKNNDTLITIPMTSTGYLRRIVKDAMHKYPHQKLIDTIPNVDVYQMLCRAFEGGDTHANRHFSGKILKNVESDDRVSSYPAVQIHERYPVGKWIRLDNATPEQLESLTAHGYAYVMDITYDNIRLIDDYWCDPILSKSKCYDIEDAVYDNGRILSAGHLWTTITDVKHHMMQEIYTQDSYTIGTVYYSKYGRLPSMYRDIIIDKYKDKTRLKGVDGEEYYYHKSKELTNSNYGLSAQDPGKTIFDFIDNEFYRNPATHDELYERNKYKSMLSYAWGVWVTSWARYHLYLGMRLVYEQGGYVYYWDTDSLKHSPGIDFKEYNNARIQEGIESNSYGIDSKGNKHYLGVYEPDGSYTQFKTLGAKKYVYYQKDKRGIPCLHITIAGVNKSKGAMELWYSGGLDAFKDGFVFEYGGGTKSKYYSNYHKSLEIDGHKLDISDNVCITPTTYKVGLTGDYEFLLSLLNSDKNSRELLCNITGCKL